MSSAPNEHQLPTENDVYARCMQESSLKQKVFGAWLSPVRALGLGPRGREFESHRPDTYLVYIHQSQKTGKYYSGGTGNVQRRLESHNGGETKSTSAGIPWRVVHIENLQLGQKP